jgi:hypothetical protein
VDRWHLFLFDANRHQVIGDAPQNLAGVRSGSGAPPRSSCSTAASICPDSAPARSPNCSWALRLPFVF